MIPDQASARHTACFIPNLPSEFRIYVSCNPVMSPTLRSDSLVSDFIRYPLLSVPSAYPFNYRPSVHFPQALNLHWSCNSASQQELVSARDTTVPLLYIAASPGPFFLPASGMNNCDDVGKHWTHEKIAGLEVILENWYEVGPAPMISFTTDWKVNIVVQTTAISTHRPKKNPDQRFHIERIFCSYPPLFWISMVASASITLS